MKKEFLCAHEYRTPVCKVVRVMVATQLLQSSVTNVTFGGSSSDSLTDDEGDSYFGD